MTYSQIKNAVVNQELYSRVAVTNPELIAAGAKAGFVLTKVQDDLTERIFYASNVLTDGNGMVVPTFSGSILITGDSLKGNPSSILSFSDGYYTILPTTTFVIPNTGTTCVPMTNAAVQAMGAMTPGDLVTELNTGKYLRQAFHITLVTTPMSPSVSVYNLMSPAMTSLTFNAENPHSAPQMSLTSCSIVHQANGTGGFLINAGITRSLNILPDNAANYAVILTCLDKMGSLYYLPLTYLDTVNNLDVWQSVLGTTYHITNDDFIQVMMYDTNDTLTECYIPISQTFTVLTAFYSNAYPTIPTSLTLNALLPASYQTTYTAMAQQTMVMTLGTDLTNSIYSGVNTTWGNNVYQTAPSNVYYTTNVPIFQLNSQGVINTRYNTSTRSLQSVLMYEAGSIPPSGLDIQLTVSDSVSVPTGNTGTVIPISDTTGVLVGMPIRGVNIPVHSTVSSFTPTSITISSIISGVISQGTIIVGSNNSIDTNVSTTQDVPGIILNVANTTNVLEGMSVYGFDIPEGTTVASVMNSNQITISIPTTTQVQNGTLLTIVNNTAHGVVKVAAGSIMTDANGNAIIINDAPNQYRIPSILFDGRLFASDDPSDTALVGTIYSTLQNYANQILNIDSGLIEVSNVYYVPYRTMGYANFAIGNNQTVSMSLELNFYVTIYVSIAVLNNTTLIETMTSTINSIVSANISNPIISVSDITASIRSSLGTNIVGIEIAGINNNDNMRMISVQDTGVTPSIQSTLIVNSDGTISRDSNINISWIAAPTPATNTISIT